MPSDKAPTNEPSETTPAPPPSETSETPVAHEYIAPQATAKKPTSKKKWIVGVAIIAALVVAGSALAMYNRPQNVMADSLTKLVTADTVGFKGEASLKIKGQDSLTVTSKFDAQSGQNVMKLTTENVITTGAADVKVNINSVGNQEASYFQVTNAKALADTAMAFVGESSPYAAAIETTAQKVDNKWIKVTSEANNPFGQCAAALQDLKLSRQDQLKLRDIFMSNQFVVGKPEGIGTVEQRYELLFNEKAGQSFTKEALELTPLKNVKQACNIDTPTFDGASNEAKGIENGKIVLTVNRVTHEPTQLEVTVDDNDATFTMAANISQGIAVKAEMPASNVIKFEDLLGDLMSAWLGASLGEAGRTLDETQQQLLQEQIDASLRQQ